MATLSFVFQVWIYFSAYHVRQLFSRVLGFQVALDAEERLDKHRIIRGILVETKEKFMTGQSLEGVCDKLYIVEKMLVELRDEQNMEVEA